MVRRTKIKPKKKRSLNIIINNKKNKVRAIDTKVKTDRRKNNALQS